MNKKEKIIHAAIEAFRDKGIEKTKISDIVTLAGIAQGTFYLYFPSKLAVMPAIAEVMVEKTIAAVKNHVQAEESFITKLEQMIDAIFMVTRDYREVLALIYAGLASTEYIKEWETIYEPFCSWVSTFLKQAKTSGVIRDSIDVGTAKLVIGLIESSAEQIYLYDFKQEDKALIQKAEVLEFLKHALGVQE
ncbi:TetR family transcriptional regulator [Aneurinibacillus soli]|uniref:Putative HTH-type transcriptional regulator YvdT n=2 Tax=Aneurinibacillus soli TaxID=1500254 RepID=A0A0U4WJ12_9BACL|nr:TetR family transcriptional regulator [Aneurinibacillus soli]BAU28571.1 putative HTH-type transcriptional regulator YvdT [Aneurinibacillus soli]